MSLVGMAFVREASAIESKRRRDERGREAYAARPGAIAVRIHGGIRKRQASIQRETRAVQAGDVSD
jgi:hypothetical protein